MKSIRGYLTVCLIMVLAGPAVLAQDAGAQRMSREDLQKYLAESRQKFLKSIEGLSEAQWKFKPAPDRWSVAEVAEHITVTEQFFVQMVRDKMLKNAEAAQRPEGEGVTDQKFLALIVDRSQPAQAPEMLQPQSKFSSQAELVKAFEAIRKETAELTSQTPETELRGRYTKFPTGHVVDAQQIVLLAAAHALRHTAQIEEVKAHEDFPK